MKKISILILSIISLNASSQILVRNLQGEPIFSPIIRDNQKNTLVNLNTGTQSLGLDYLFTTKSKNPADYSIYRFGISTKSTDGIGALLINGQFSPSVKLNFAKTKIRVFANEIMGREDGYKHKFDDWLTINASLNYEKNKLINIIDTSFKKQITDTVFKGYGLGVDYNMVLGVEEQHYINFAVNYNRKNNYEDLTSLDVIDRRVKYDSSSSIQRSVEKKVTAKEGLYKEMDAATIQVSYTQMPKYQSPTDEKGNANPNFKSLKVGYSIFYNVLAQTHGLPETKLGGSLFIISPDKNNILIPRIAINMQIRDLYDVKNKNNGIAKRIQLGLSATFSL